MSSVRFRLNGVETEVDADPDSIAARISCADRSA